MGSTMKKDVAGRRPVVLQVVPRLGMGGAEIEAIAVARAVVEAGGRAIVAAERGPLGPELLRAGARHVVMPVASKSPLTIRRNVGRLAALIRDDGVDIVHARSRAPAWSARGAARLTGRPFVTTFHAAYGAAGELKRRYNAVMAGADRVIAVSEFIARHVGERYGVDGARLRCVLRGVDIGVFDPGSVSAERVASLATRWQLPDGVAIVMLPGRLAYGKGHHVMVDALTRIRRGDVLCVMVGVGGASRSRRRRLERAIEAPGVAGRVRLIDRCGDMAAAFRLADVVVSASTEPEGFGRVAVEAQAMGVPVVATNRGAALETIEPSVTGWLVPPGDASALAAAVDTALDLDEAGRLHLAALARERVVRRFSSTRMCAETLAVYDELLDDRIAFGSGATAPVAA